MAIQNNTLTYNILLQLVIYVQYDTVMIFNTIRLSEQKKAIHNQFITDRLTKGP